LTSNLTLNFLNEPDLLLYMNTKMESETNKAPTTSIPSPDELISISHLPEEVLRHIATFLDFQSLKNFRLVSPEWNAACFPILRKRGTCNLSHPCHENERPDLLEGAMDYSSWKINHSVYKSSETLHDHQIWVNVRSLIIHQKTPLSREFHRWAWETISEAHCPHLQDLTFMFESADGPYGFSKVDSEVESDYQEALQGHQNASFPDISPLTSLGSVTFKGIWDKTTAYFAQHLLAATNPTSLRHLYFCPIGDTEDVYLDILDRGAYRIFTYLKRNPALLRNLQSFGFYLGGPSAVTRNEDHSVIYGIDYKESAFTKFVKGAVGPLPFGLGGKLKSLFWDQPFYLGNHLLPGVLTPSIAFSLVQLSLTRRLESLDEGVDNRIDTPIKISFPYFPRLRSLKLGLFAGRSLSVPELVDSAPNLAVLESIGLNKYPLSPNEMSGFWRGAEEGSVPSPKQHSKLRIFCTDIPFTDGLFTLQKISSKFPHLVELRLGSVRDVELDSFLSFVKSHHPELQRLSWSFESFELKFTLPELLRHLSRVPEQLPSLTIYSFGCDERTGIRRCSMEELQISANRLLSLFSSSSNEKTPSLPINLFLKFKACGCEHDEENSVRNGFDCNPCYLRQFFRRHDLPIRMLSTREIEEMENKFIWDHRFANSRIYK
jgi:hypothetical protein